MLYYKKANDESDWKSCVRSMDKTKKIIESCHAGVGGMYHNSIYKKSLWGWVARQVHSFNADCFLLQCRCIQREHV